MNGSDFLTPMQIAGFLKRNTKLHLKEAIKRVFSLDDYNTLVIFRSRNAASEILSSLSNIFGDILSRNEKAWHEIPSYERCGVKKELFVRRATEREIRL